MNSSIFNFKHLLSFNWSFIGLISLLITADTSVFHNSEMYPNAYDFVGQMGQIKRSFEMSNPAKITTIILGDSQSIDALRPELMAPSVGMDPASIFNFSLTGGKAFEIYHTYLTYEKKLPILKQAIVVVNEHQINSYAIDKDSKFRFYASFEDRLRVMNKDNYGELLLGWVFKAYDMRSTWVPMFDSFLKKGPAKEIKPQKGGLPAVLSVDPSHKTSSWAQETAERWFDHYQPDGIQTDSFESLMSSFQKRGIKVTVIMIPRSAEFEAAVMKLHPKERQVFLDKVSFLAKHYGATFNVMSNQGLSLKEYFRDTNHLNPKGAAIVSKSVAETWLK